jgi:hypothetical protein
MRFKGRVALGQALVGPDHHVVYLSLDLSWLHSLPLAEGGKARAERCVCVGLCVRAGGERELSGSRPRAVPALLCSSSPPYFVRIHPFPSSLWMCVWGQTGCPREQVGCPREQVGLTC